MKRIICGIGALLLISVVSGQEPSPPTQVAPKPFPGPDFILLDRDLKPQKGGVVLGPLESDGKGGTKGSFAVYGAHL